MPLWRTYTALQPRTRIILGLSIIAYASIVMYATDQVSPSLGFEATEKDREELRRYVPRVSVHEREKDNGEVKRREG